MSEATRWMGCCGEGDGHGEDGSESDGVESGGEGGGDGGVACNGVWGSITGRNGTGCCKYASASSLFRRAVS